MRAVAWQQTSRSTSGSTVATSHDARIAAETAESRARALPSMEVS